MTKAEFLANLEEALYGLPKEDIDERINFYSEMIDDRMEEGISECEAVEAVGLIDEIVFQTVSDVSLLKIVKEKAKAKKNRKLQGWEIVLICVGAPLWLPLLIAALSVILSFYVVMWSLIVSLWAVFGSLGGAAIGGLVSGVFFAIFSNPTSGIFLIASSLVSAGLCILSFFACKALTKAILLLTKKIAISTKNSFRKKEI